MKSEFFCGQVLRAAYPFVQAVYDKPPEDSDGEFPKVQKVQTWRPGVNSEPQPPYGEYGEDYADGMGEVVYQIISVHKPGGFPTRVFFTRHWVDPNGKAFGKAKLRITTQQAFRNLLKGWRHDFVMSDA